MVQMNEEWRLRYSGTDFRFGDCASGYISPWPIREARTFVVQDRRMPGADTRAMGRDSINPGDLTFSPVTIRGKNPDDTRRMRSKLSAVWRADSIRNVPSAMASLTAPSGRFVIGRPRKFSMNDRDLAQSMAVAVMSFELVDERWFGEPGQARLNQSTPPTGGLVAPLTAPLTTMGPSVLKSEAAVVGGELDTPFELVVHGPLINPVITLAGPRAHVMKFYITGSLGVGDVLVLNTRPEVRTVFLNGRPAGGRLSPRSSRLSEAVLRPGTYTVTLEGISENATAYADLLWNDAYAEW